MLPAAKRHGTSRRCPEPGLDVPAAPQRRAVPAEDHSGGAWVPFNPEAAAGCALAAAVYHQWPQCRRC